MSFKEWRIISFQEAGLEIEDGDRGKNYPKKNELFDKGYCPFLNNKNIIGDEINFNEVDFITKEKDEVLRKGRVKINDIILTTRGSVGNVGYFNKRLKYSFARINSGMVIIRANHLFYTPYLYQLLKSPYMKMQYKNFSTGSAQPQLPIRDIKKLNLILPPYNEQIAIADILSSLDEKIELNNQMNETLEEMAQALFKRWFVDFEFPNEEGKPYKSSGGEMVESELGMIPKGWSITTLDHVCSLLTKSVKPFENPDVLYEHFSLPACDEGKLPVIEFGNQISSNKYMVDNTCILISKLNPATKRIWDPVCKENSICSTEFMVYQPKNSEIKSFCYEMINSDRFTEYLLCNVTGSTGSRQRVQPKLTLKYQFAISSRNLIEQFSDLVKPMHNKVKENIQENKILKKTRDTLLPKLMSGEIRVSDLKS